MTRHRSRITAASATLLAALVLVGLPLAPAAASAAPAPAAAPAAADLEGLDYVALGDSYSAGFGIEPFSYENPADGCFQADENYPKQVAASLGLTLDDRTCSGAVTANIIDTPQLTITKEGTAPPQSGYLSADTDVVTVSIGGNDLGFADVAQFCVTVDPGKGVLGNPLFDNCVDYFAPTPETDQLAYKLETVVTPALENTFARIAEKAPNAEVFVVGYPAIAPDVPNTPEGGCFTTPLADTPPYPENSFPYSGPDTVYLHDTEAKLDAAIRTKAEAAGFHYLSTLPQSESHSACQTDGSAYVNGITLLLQVPGEKPVGGTPTPDPYLFVKYGALHPNAAGVSFLAEQVTTAIDAAVDPTPDPGEEPQPSPAPSGSPDPTPAPVPAPGSSSSPAGTGGGTPAPSLAATGASLAAVAPLGLLAVALLAGAGGLLIVRHRMSRR